MFNNKNGLTFAIQIMIAFAISTMAFIFTSYLIFYTGEEYVVSITADTAKDILRNSTNLADSQGYDTVNTLQERYTNLYIPYDLFFLLSLILAISTTIVSTFESRKEGIFSFFGYVFIGSLVLLLITTYVSGFTTWFNENLIQTVFANVDNALPIMNWYLSNLGIINFIWFLSLLLLSVVDRNFISRSGVAEP